MAYMIEAMPSIMKNAISTSDGDDGRDKRPPEPRRSAGPERGDQSDDSSDQEYPADDDGKRQCGNQGHRDGRQAENDENDAFGQKQAPVLLNRAGECAPDRFGLSFHSHRSPLVLLPGRNVPRRPVTA